MKQNWNFPKGGGGRKKFLSFKAVASLLRFSLICLWDV